MHDTADPVRDTYPDSVADLTTKNYVAPLPHA